MSSRNYIFIGAILSLCVAVGAHAQNTFTLDVGSGALSVANTPVAVSASGQTATIFLDITTITTPDAGDEIDFYIQTCYDVGCTSWTDIENIHFANADNGNTAQRVIVIDGARDGPGTIQSLTGTNPAAGVEVSETVPADTIWLLKSVRFTLVTDANADIRQVHLVLDDGTITLLNLPTTGTQIEGIARNYNAHALGGLIVPTGSEIDIGLPSDVVLHAGYRIVTETTLFKAGDNFGAPQLSVEAQHDSHIHTDGTIGDNLRSYGRPLGSQIRIKTVVTDSDSDVVYAFSALGVFK